MKIANLPEFDIRYTQLDDESSLREWLQTPGMLHWFPMQEEKEIEDAVQCWIGFCRYSCSLTATFKGMPVAIGTLFLMPYRKVAHYCLLKMIVDPKYHRQGIATALVKNLKHLAKNYFRLERIHVEVFEDNPLISVLEKAGFHAFARQERFVKTKDHYLARILLEYVL